MEDIDKLTKAISNPPIMVNMTLDEFTKQKNIAKNLGKVEIINAVLDIINTGGANLVIPADASDDIKQFIETVKNNVKEKK